MFIAVPKLSLKRTRLLRVQHQTQVNGHQEREDWEQIRSIMNCFWANRDVADLQNRTINSADCILPQLTLLFFLLCSSSPCQASTIKHLKHSSLNNRSPSPPASLSARWATIKKNDYL